MKGMLLTLAPIIIGAATVYAQSVPGTDPITAKTFALPQSPVVDSNVAAVVLSDIGSITIVGKRDEDWFASVYRRKRRILIRHKSAFDLASFAVRLYGDDKLDSLEAITYTLENGKVVQTKLLPADKFEDKLSPERKIIRFTLPNLKEGAIIEVLTRVTMDRINYFPDWRFQYEDYPCLYSSFSFTTPEMLRYAALRKGVDSITATASKGKWEIIQLATLNVGDDIYRYNWEGRDIPAFRETEFIHATSDYADKLELYLTQFASRSSNSTQKNPRQVNDLGGWQVLNSRLLNSSYFGFPARADRNENLRDLTEKLTSAATNPMESAKALYAYVRDNFKTEGSSDLYIYRSLYDINKSKKGDPTELNMLLLGLLRVKGLKADPVVLSTRSFGYHNAQYPLPEKLNYVLVRLQMYGVPIYLDASDPLMGFGKIPIDCYNGHARAIAETDTADVFFYADSLREMNNTTVFAENGEKGLSGYYESTPGYHQGLALKRDAGKYGLGKFFKNYHGSAIADFSFYNEAIDSLHEPGSPTKVHFEFTVRQKTENGDLLYFSPVFSPAYPTNPFSAASRQYPVELEMPVDEMYVLNMEMPKGYKVEELPQSAKVAFGTDGFFEYTIHADAENIQLRTRIKLNRTVYEPDEYNDLREFFAFVIKKQAEQIVFKKTKT